MKDSGNHPDAGREWVLGASGREGKADAARLGRKLGFSRKYQPKTVVEVLEQCFSFRFRDRIDSYLQTHISELTRMGKIPWGWDEVSLTGCRFRWIKSILEQPLSGIWMDLIFECQVEDKKRRERKGLLMAVRVCLDLRPCHNRDFPSMSVRLYQKGEKDELFDRPDVIRLNAYLIPFIRNASYSDLAMRVLERLYPADLEHSDEVVSGDVFAESLHLPRISFPFSRGDGDTDMGRILFVPDLMHVIKDDGTEADYLFDEVSILINSRRCRTKRDTNFTVLHECVHFILDRFFFFLQYMADRKYVFAFDRSQGIMEAQESEIQTGKSMNKSEWSPIDWMEYQAERLPIYLVLNEKQTRRCIEQCIAEHGGSRSMETIHACVCRISEKFDVSLEMAKIRMIELGYPEAEGVFNYDRNRRRLQDYECRIWENGVTYTIDEDKLQEQLLCNEELQKAVEGNRYRYIDGHLCLNDQKYVRGNGRRWWMTEYARRHLDECCISFNVVKNGPSKPGAYYQGTAARERLLRYASRTKIKPVTDKYLPCPTFRKEPSDAMRVKENNDAYEDAIRWAKLEQEMPGDFGLALKEVMRVKGLTQEELAFRLGVSRTIIQDIAADNRLTLSHVVGICKALEVPYYISDDLVQLAGFNLKPIGITKIYKNFLASPTVYSVEKCNEILMQRGLSPFFQGGDGLGE